MFPYYKRVKLDVENKNNFFETLTKGTKNNGL